VSDIRGLFECADVFVLCSDAEALGRSVVEAMAIGVPVVVTDSGGTHEIVDDRRTGIVVRGGDATELARGLEKMLMDRPFAERCAAAAKAFVTTELNAERTAARVASIYRRLVDTTPHTSARYYSRKGLPVP
jgi:glycosyltransferase involved in cell wall biosynthesis